MFEKCSFDYSCTPRGSPTAPCVPQLSVAGQGTFAGHRPTFYCCATQPKCHTNMSLYDCVTDIGSIMNVEELLTLPSAVSWTDKPFTYYVHTIDRSLVSWLTSRLLLVNSWSPVYCFMHILSDISSLWCPAGHLRCSGHNDFCTFVYHAVNMQCVSSAECQLISLFIFVFVIEFVGRDDTRYRLNHDGQCG